MKKATKQQLKYFHYLTRQHDMKELRAGMALGASGNRTNDPKELSTKEMSALISNLTTDDAATIMRRKIFSLAHTIGWSKFDAEDELIPDYDHINGWMMQYSYLHKPLGHYSEAELPKLITQFEEMVKSELKGHVN